MTPDTIVIGVEFSRKKSLFRIIKAEMIIRSAARIIAA
jgi:hypothetical protein